VEIRCGRLDGRGVLARSGCAGLAGRTAGVGRSGDGRLAALPEPAWVGRAPVRGGRSVPLLGVGRRAGVDPLLVVGRAGRELSPELVPPRAGRLAGFGLLGGDCLAGRLGPDGREPAPPGRRVGREPEGPPGRLLPDFFPISLILLH
jgi:hypothetical protein